MKKFQKGDLIELTVAGKRATGYSAKAGALARVEGYHKTEHYEGPIEYVDISWLRTNGLAREQVNGGYEDKDFKLVSRKTENPLKLVIEEAIETIRGGE